MPKPLYYEDRDDILDKILTIFHRHGIVCDKAWPELHGQCGLPDAVIFKLEALFEPYTFGYKNYN